MKETGSRLGSRCLTARQRVRTLPPRLYSRRRLLQHTPRHRHPRQRTPPRHRVNPRLLIAYKAGSNVRLVIANINR